MSKGLEGIVVLDLSSLFPGPYCTSLLHSMGAEVWKIERPGSSDPLRYSSEAFACLNWGKKSITLDFRQPEGKAVFRRMVEQADVIVEGFRPGVMERQGIDYKAIREVNPKIVYCSISGFGQDGPYMHKSVHDVNIQGLCGSLSPLVNEEADPDPILPLSDLTAGIFAALGISNALLKRHASGEGSYVDISMADPILTWVELSQLVRVRSESPRAKNGYDTMDRATPHYGTFGTRDGKAIALGIVLEDHWWKSLCTTIEKPEWMDMDHGARVKAGREMRKELHHIFKQKDRDEWFRILADDLPVTPVNSLEEAIEDPQFVHRQIVQLAELNGTTIPLVRNPVLPPNVVIEGSGSPKAGEHTLEILQRVGFDNEEIERLQRLKVV